MTAVARVLEMLHGHFLVIKILYDHGPIKVEIILEPT